MRGWIANSWLSCRKYTERMSRMLDEPLSAWERFGYLAHHYWCESCRRYRRQVIEVESAIEELAVTLEDNGLTDDVEEVLDPESSQRIHSTLVNELNSAD